MPGLTIKFNKKLIPFVIFGFFLIISLFTYNDYGIAWDEPCQQDFGELALDKITNPKSNNPNYSIEKQRYGISFEATITFIQEVFQIKSDKNIYLFRHFFTHFIFLLAALFFYFFIKRTTYQKLAWLGMLILILSPRIYGHSFFNSKDLPLLSFTIFSLYAMQSIWLKPKIINYVIFGVLSAYLINIRVIGLLIPFAFGINEIILLIKKSRTIKDFFILNAILTVSFVLFTILFWPYLWSSPIDRFLETFNHFKAFYWDDLVLFNGSQIPANELPWYYSITWMSISIPVGYLFFFLVGLIISFKEIIKTKNYHIAHLIIVLFPIVVLPLLNSVVYDGWRHLYFIYPSLIFISIVGIFYLIERFKKKLLIYYLTSFYILFIFIEMITIHPFEHLYFNEIAGKYKQEYLRTHYEIDYWGTCFNEGYNKLKELNPNKEITVIGNITPYQFNAMMLDKQSKIKVVTDFDSANYFISNYRFHPQDYQEYNEIYSRKIYNSTLYSIFELK